MGNTSRTNPPGTEEGEQPPKRKRGRPKKPDAEAKRHYVTVVMAEPIKEAIREAAERNGRSVSSEIDFRLGMSLALERDTGSAPVRRLIDFTRLAALKLQEEMGAEWTENDKVAQSVLAALFMYLADNTAAGDGEHMFTDDVFGRAMELTFELRKLFEIRPDSCTRGPTYAKSKQADSEEDKQEDTGEETRFSLQQWLQEISTSVNAGDPDPSNDEAKLLIETVAQSTLASRENARIDVRPVGRANLAEPDMIVSLPGSRLLSVDAKVRPNDPPVTVRQRAEELIAKPHTSLRSEPDAIILYVPSEALLAKALEEDPSLWDRAFESRVLIASPDHLRAVLDTVDLAWENEELQMEFARRSKGTTTAGAPETTR